MKLRKLRNVFGLAALGWILGSGTTFAQTATWLGGAEAQVDRWDAANNWSRSSGILTVNALPIAGDVAVFGDRLIRNITVGTTARAAGTLRFAGVTTGAGYTIGGALESSPQINLSGQTSLVEVTSGLGATVNARLGVLGNDVARTISNAGSSELNLAGGISFQGTGNHTLTVGGTSAVRIGSLTTGGASTLVVNRANLSTGSLLIDGGVSGNVTVASGAVVTGTTTLTGNMTVSGSVANLTVNSGAAQINANGSVNNLTLNAGSAQINGQGSVSTLIVNAGSVQVNANGSVTSLTTSGSAVVNGTAGTVNVNSGGVLSGIGTIGTATIANGGQHNPGNSPGLQRFTNLTYNSGSTFVWELTGNGTSREVDFDAVNVSNTLTFDSGAVSNLVIDTNLLNNTAFWSTNRSWQVFNAGTVIGSLAITPAQAAQFSSLGTFSWSGGTLNFASVPEPGTLALLGVMSTVGFGVARFRKRKTKTAV